MKKAAALFLSVYMLAGSLFPGNGFFEFSEVPSLLRHYQYHRTIETPGVGFFDFMVMHYADLKHEKSDPVNHTKLPAHHSYSIVGTDQLLTSGILVKMPQRNFTQSTKLPGNNHFFIPLQFTESVFHPPKV